MNLESFLHELRENPDDLGQRLVFADWLEDNGDPERAELIRLQLGGVPRAPWDGGFGTAGTPREQELIDRVAARWAGDLGELHGMGIEVGFRQGMVQMNWRGDTSAGWQRGLELVRSGWVERLEFAVWGMEGIAELPTADLAGIHWLSLSVERGEAGQIGSFLAPLSHLRRLEFHFTDYWEGAAELLGGFLRLDWLLWSSGTISRDQLSALLPVLSRCRTLSLGNCFIRDEGLAVLLDGLPAGRLRTLGLADAELTPDGISRLTECDKLASLRALDISSNEVGDAAAAALAASPHLRRLLHLDLSNAGIGPAGVKALASSPILANLLTLGLGNNGLHAEGARSLADSPHLGGLARLSLPRCSIGLSGVRELVLSDRLAGLAAIHLDSNPIDQVRWDDRLTLEDWRALCRFSASPNPSTDEVRALCAALREGSAPLRRHVAPILERQWRERHAAMPVEAEAALVLALDDDEGLVRRSAGVALLAVAPGVAALPRLVELLDSQNEETVALALRLIAAQGETAQEAEPLLLRGLATGHAEVVVHQARALASIGASSPRAVAAFRGWVRSDHPDLRKAGALGLARLRLEPDEVVSAWHRCAGGPARLDEPFLAALGGWPEAVQRLVAFANDPAVSIRGAVAHVLALAREPREAALAALVRLLRDTEPAPRQHACHAVQRGGWRSPDLLAPLVGCLEDPRLERPAIGALRVQGDLAAAAVPELLRVGVERRHHDAFLLCRDLGALTQPFHEAFRQELRRANVHQVWLARMALRQCAANWPDAVAILSTWQADPCENVQTAAEVLRLMENGPATEGADATGPE